MKFGAPNALLLTALFRSGSGGCGNSQGCYRIVLRDMAAREFNAFLWVFLIAVTAFLTSKVVKLLSLWAKANRIPGPPSPSFYGHSKLISRENLIGQSVRFSFDLLFVSRDNYQLLKNENKKVQWNLFWELCLNFACVFAFLF